MCVCAWACKRLLTDETQWIPAGWRQRGLSPKGRGVTVRHDAEQGPQNKFNMENHGSCVQSAPNSLIKQIQLQLESYIAMIISMNPSLKFSAM